MYNSGRIRQSDFSSVKIWRISLLLLRVHQANVTKHVSFSVCCNCKLKDTAKHMLPAMCCSNGVYSMWRAVCTVEEVA